MKSGNKASNGASQPMPNLGIRDDGSNDDVFCLLLGVIDDIKITSPPCALQRSWAYESVISPFFGPDVILLSLKTQNFNKHCLHLIKIRRQRSARQSNVTCANIQKRFSPAGQMKRRMKRIASKKKFDAAFEHLSSDIDLWRNSHWHGQITPRYTVATNPAPRAGPRSPPSPGRRSTPRRPRRRHRAPAGGGCDARSSPACSDRRCRRAWR